MPLWLQLLALILATAFGVVFLIRLRSIDDALWQSRLIIYKRLEIYDQIAPDLNRIYCFRRLLGYWKEISPPDLIATKRRLDRAVNINRHLLSEEFYRAYLDFMGVTFRTFTGPGEDAKIRAVVVHELGDRRVHAAYDWDEAYEWMFDAEDMPTDYQVDEAYMQAMNGLKRSVGLRD
ncbi:hypothetical protein [Alterinioella nitratireducens]|uniref:hypothetical protein n=1 Tax=Alterinioella nitratireducens TaxID=2735915 RepID=UPI001557E547|nr:hypothetical protein [Alterinioella nitratireducens]NPD21129.1 hypothetical protein [Alterinioella nitratireducens]